MLQATGQGDRREVLAGLFGLEVARQMLEVTFEDDYMRVKGFISPVALTRSNRREITFFVNGRWVQDSSLTAALLQAYHTLLMVGRYPIATLFVEMPPEEVDVNVHPAKAEVRFRSQDRAFSGVQRAVRRALLAYSPVPPVSASTWQQPSGSERPTFENSLNWDLSHSTQAAQSGGWEAQLPDLRTHGPAPWDEGPVEGTLEDDSSESGGEGAPVSGEGQASAAAQSELASGMLPLLRLIGQVGASYLVAEGPDGLYLIDQHAAHERVLFERFLRQRSGTIAAQSLLEPAVIQLPPSSAHLLQSQLEVLGRIGFDVEPFGPNTFRVRAIPALLGGADALSAVRVVIEDFEEDETPLQAEIEEKIIARVCKRAAVKAGQTLSSTEQAALLRDLEACNSPRTCPHGRPTMIHLPVDLLERQFGRRGGR